jgi:hypothetical protein
MIARSLLIFIICFNLAFPHVGFAGTDSSSLQVLLTQHRMLIGGVGGMELIAANGKELADLTFKLMKNPENKNFLNSEEGIELRKRQTLLLNFLAIKDHFEKCVKDKAAKRKLRERILEAGYQNMTELGDHSLPCVSPSFYVNQNYLNFNNDVMKAMKKIAKPYFQNELSKQVILNTAKSMLAFRQKFRPEFMEHGHLTQADLDSILESVCDDKMHGKKNLSLPTDVCNKLAPHFRNTVGQAVMEYSKTQRSEKYSLDKATNALNTALGRINHAIEKIDIKKDEDAFFDSPDVKDEKTNAFFNEYVSAYSNEASQNAGSLLLTDAIKDRAGGLKSLDKNDMIKNKSAGEFQFIPHQSVLPKDVKNAISEVERKMQTQASDTMEIAYEATAKKGVITSDENAIANLVRINPFAAGQVLIRRPEYAGLMCDAINEINQHDVDKKNHDKYFKVGSAILGGALVLTGVGTTVGGYLITGSLTAGVATGTMGATILGYTTLASGAVEVGNISYRSKRSYDEYQEMKELEAAYLNHNGDSGNLIDARDALIEFKHQRLKTAMALASLGGNVVGALNFPSLSLSSVQSPEFLKSMTKIMSYLEKTEIGKKLARIMVLMGARAQEKVQQFLIKLAGMGENARIKFLEMLESKSYTPEQLKNIIESALDIAKNNSKN